MARWNGKKVVTLVWDGANWNDQETGSFVTGIDPPDPQFSEKPIIPRIEATPGLMYGFAATQVLTIIDAEFTRRTIPEVPPYMMDGKWLVTYEWLQREGDYRQSRIDDLQHQIDQLRHEKQKPWWKRW